MSSILSNDEGGRARPLTMKPVAKDPEDKLRELLRARAAALKETALNSDGWLPAEELEALGRLARFSEICAALRTEPEPRRWPVIVLLGGALAIASFLLFARVWSTEIELQALATSVGFVLSTRQLLTEPTSLVALGAAGLREIEVPGFGARTAETWAPTEGGELAVRFSTVADAAAAPASITMAALALASGTRVVLHWAEEPRVYRLSLAPSAPELRADMQGQIRVERSYGKAEQLDFKSPKAVVLRPVASYQDIDLWFPERLPRALSPQLAVRELSFLAVDEFLSGHAPVVRHVSTLLSGTLFFESLDGKERKIRSGERLQLHGLAGEVRSLQLHDDHLSIVLQGRVQDLTTGSGDDRRSIMPSLLEWLSARHGLSLFWGSALYLFGLGVSVLRWWRRP